MNEFNGRRFSQPSTEEATSAFKKNCNRQETMISIHRKERSRSLSYRLTANRSTVYHHPIIAPGPDFILRSGKMEVEKRRYVGIVLGKRTYEMAIVGKNISVKKL